MIVTDLEYHLETKLVQKLDIMIKRCTNTTSRKDAVLIVEGSEGEGKSNSSEAIAYYVKSKAGMDIHMFFRLPPLIKFAKDNENKIIIWDEPALDSLSTDWYRTTNKDLIRLLMTCRKKRHFFIFNFVKFYKFSEYVVVDRALGLIHMYSRGGTIPGRFQYIRKKKLEKLYTDYRKIKKRNYKECRSFGGSFPIIENKMGSMGITIEGTPDCDLKMYERLKDKAISSIGGDGVAKLSPEHRNLMKLKKKLAGLTFPIKNKGHLVEKLGLTRATLYNWGKIVTDKLENEENDE